MNYKSLILVACSSVLFACNSEPAEKPVEKVEVANEEIETSFNPKDQLSLNDGKKWKANQATNLGIENMQKIVDNYLEVPDSIDVDSMQMVLFSEFRTLVAKCTMKGEAHEQLHYYILPLKKKIDALKEGDVDENIQELDSYLVTYRNYFE